MSLLLCCPLLFSDVSAQTAPITSSGLNTLVGAPTNVPGGKVQHDITGGTRPGNGPNLFHSFGEFGVPSNNIANFLNDSGRTTSNILGRVTGGNSSNIFGTIQTTGFGNANLFLMNPAGILFGPNATLNVGGSVHFTTADYLRLSDGVRFNTIPNAAADALLSTAPVAAFGFLSLIPAAISVQGSVLSVPAGESISLVGGDISIQAGTLEDGISQAAHLSAPGGQIRLASVASTGEILHPTVETASNINGQTFSSMGTITMSENATVDVSGDAAGTVRIRAGQLVMENSTISADTVNTSGATIAVDISLTGDLSMATDLNPAITARTTGSGDAGEIRISSANMTVTSGMADYTSVIDSHTSGSGKAGNVNITTGNLEATGNDLGNSGLFFIDSGTSGPDGGHGGDVTIAARNINLSSQSINTGDFIDLNLFGEATGSGGNLSITADSLKLTFTFLAADAALNGQAGEMTITARDIQISGSSSLQVSGFQKAGTLRIAADRLTVDDSQITFDTVVEPGGGILISGRTVEFRNGSTVSSQTAGNAAAADINITATDHLTLSDDPATEVAFGRPTGLFTNSFGLLGPGNAGAIIITTPSLEISGGARIDTTTRSSGSGGPVTITADRISISGTRSTPIGEALFGQAGLSSGVYSRTTGNRFCSGSCGNAGTISITTGALTMGSGSAIDSSTSSTGRGGDISINATGPLSISGTLGDGTPSGIFSRTVDAGTGAGGNINLMANQVSLANGAAISAQSTSVGNAGNVSIQAADSFSISNSTVTTSTMQSDGGNITITAGNLVQLDHSEIATNVQGGAGTGGNISIDPPAVILEASKIIASAIGGNGGNINIVAGVFLASPDSLIDASSTFGLSGAVTIDSPIKNLSSTLAPLPQGFLQVAGLLQGRCAARFEGGLRSSLVVAGRDAIPVEPGDVLLGPIFSAGEKPVVARSAVPGVRVTRTVKEPASDHGLTLPAPAGAC